MKAISTFSDLSKALEESNTSGNQYIHVSISAPCECSSEELVECNSCGHEEYEETHDEDCKICDGDGYIPNPALKEIKEMMV